MTMKKKEKFPLQELGNYYFVILTIIAILLAIIVPYVRYFLRK